MKKIRFITLAIIILANYSIITNAQSSQQQKFIFPEKLWKTHCEGMVSNVIFTNLPMDIKVSPYKSNSGDAILQGDIFDMDKRYDNSPYYFSEGKFLIKPCSGSNEETIEINSNGLHFIYHHGIGLEYVSGTGNIKMFGKFYELPIDESKITFKDSTLIFPLKE